MYLHTIDSLTEHAFAPLLRASLDEGYTFVQSLYDDYQAGRNRFDQPGAVLLAAVLDGNWIAIGGVHPDTYLNQSHIGRIRHVYVLSAYRRTGVGRQLVTALIDHAGRQFTLLTLRTLTAHGDAFYVSLGFTRDNRFSQATHWLEIG